MDKIYDRIASLIDRISSLLTVKSLVTLTLTAVFALLTVRGAVSQEFMTIYTVVISFYFGTQAEKRLSEIRKEG